MSEVKTPWKDYMGDVPMHLDYFQGSMFEAVERMAELYPNNIAFDFMGKSTTYKKMVQEIEKCAKSLKTLGVRPGDKVTIAMPNCPQAIYMFYAVNLVGGIANMIHPLSAEKEIEFYLNASESTTAITLDQFYDKFEHIRQNTGIINIMVEGLKKRLADRSLKLCITDKAKELIIERGYDPLYGARPLRRYLQSSVETLLARAILSGDIAAGSTLTVDVENDELVCR